MERYFQAKLYNPVHLSIGAVIYDFKNSKYICLKRNVAPKLPIITFTTGTMSENTTIESTLERAMRDELGVKGEIIGYLGTQSETDIWFREIDKPTEVEKTINFMLVSLKEIDPLVKKNEIYFDQESSVEMLEYEELHEIMEKQFEKTGMNFFNFIKTLERAQKLIDTLKLQKLEAV